MASRWFKEHPRAFYLEPFLGGAAAALTLASDHGFPAAQMHLSDACQPLIDAYREVIVNPARVTRALQALIRDFKMGREGYNLVRALKVEPTSSAFAAARFFYLNALCFNGLHRENSKGVFNVPFGRRAHPTFLTTTTAMVFARYLRGALLRAWPFPAALTGVLEGSFIYADPPYFGGFSSYVASGFSEEDHGKLAAALHKLHTDKGSCIVVTNSDTREVRAMYQWMPYVHETHERRAINADPSGRMATGCLLLCTHDLEMSHACVRS
jgi:DNA adenine methylase